VRIVSWRVGVLWPLSRDPWFPGGWLLPLDPPLRAAGCCPSVLYCGRLAVAPRSSVVGGWLLPFGPLLQAAGCCPSVFCCGRLAAALRVLPRITGTESWNCAVAGECLVSVLASFVSNRKWQCENVRRRMSSPLHWQPFCN